MSFPIRGAKPGPGGARAAAGAQSRAGVPKGRVRVVLAVLQSPPRGYRWFIVGAPSSELLGYFRDAPAGAIGDASMSVARTVCEGDGRLQARAPIGAAWRQSLILHLDRISTST